MIRHVFILSLVAATVLWCWVGTAGAWKMREPTQALHYLSLPAAIGAVLLTIAVFLETGWTSTTAKMSLICATLVISNSVSTHAAARAFRVRRLGHWKPREQDGVEFIHELEKNS